MPRLLTRPAQPPLDVPFGVNPDSMQADGLVAWWPPLGSRNGGKLRDLARGHDGAASGAMTWGNHPAIGSWLTYGSTWWTVPHGDALSLAYPFTISLWVAYTAATNLVVLEKNANTGFSIQTAPGASTVAGSIGFVTGSFQTYRTTAAINDGLLHHVVFVMRSGSDQSLYVDGVAVSSFLSATLSAPTYGSATSVLIGSRTGTASFTGSVGDIRLYNRGLSAQEVWQAWDPRTRWELYLPAKRRYFAVPRAGRRTLLGVGA